MFAFDVRIEAFVFGDLRDSDCDMRAKSRLMSIKD